MYIQQITVDYLLKMKTVGDMRKFKKIIFCLRLSIVLIVIQASSNFLIVGVNIAEMPVLRGFEIVYTNIIRYVCGKTIIILISSCLNLKIHYYLCILDPSFQAGFFIG